MNNLELALKVAWSFLGKPYTWGGDDPMKGFDCSGFIVEILQSVGFISRNSDYTAKKLFEHFASAEVFVPKAGCIVFYGNPINHVEFCINKNHTIGASGGGSKTITIQDAINQNAYIKIRPLRTDYTKMIYLF